MPNYDEFSGRKNQVLALTGLLTFHPDDAFVISFN